MPWLFILMTVVPVVELYLLIELGRWMGAGATVALVLGTGLLGAALARREGLRVFRDWQQMFRSGMPAPDGVIGGVLVLLGAALLITPGVLTDVTGLLLLIPLTRRPLARWLKRYAERRIGLRSPFADSGAEPPRRVPFKRDGESEAELIAPPEGERSPPH